MQLSLLYLIEYPEIKGQYQAEAPGLSSYEQRVQPFISRYQYLLFAAKPCKIIAFKVIKSCPSPETEIDKSTPRLFSHWDPDFRVFTLKVYFKVKPAEANKHQTPPATHETAAPCSTTFTSSTTRVANPPRVPINFSFSSRLLTHPLGIMVLGLCLLVALHCLHPAAQSQISLLGF
ncbi:hypothetical protein SLA2020_088210 [Shorea laevis]